MPTDFADALYGDLSMAEWPDEESEETLVEPWSSFSQARSAIADNDQDTAIEIWHRIADTPGLEPRHYLQAWSFLRQAGKAPNDATAAKLHGLVIDVPMGSGVDRLAAYSDLSVRFISHAGSAVIWDRPDASLDEAVGLLLQAGDKVVGQIGLWDGERPPSPSAGRIRLNLLTPAGLRFGEAPFEVLAADPLGGPVVSAGLVLLEQLLGMAGEGE